jgi:amyloid beta A4 protein
MQSSSEISASLSSESNSHQTSHATEKYSELPITAASDPASSTFPTPDPYFTHFDPRMEHQSYKVIETFFEKSFNKTLILSNFCFFHFIRILKEAQQRLEETHREKVTKVMKDWSDLEERYQDMRLADPKSAQTFKQKMTARFQVVH